MIQVNRKLTASEIAELTKQGCQAENWNYIEVSQDFNTDNIYNAVFEGKVSIGSFENILTDSDGIKRKTGIYNSRIINCEIGNNVLISNIGSYIANYKIGDNVIIEDTGKVVCGGGCVFGNGTMVVTVNEGGGREVPIFNELSAQLAYITAFYRHRPEMISRIYKMVDSYCDKIRSEKGTVSENAHITGCNMLRNVNIGSYARIESASELSNGTVNSDRQQPSHIGSGVTAHDFICSRGSRVDGGVYLERCFVGEGCIIDNGYTALDSLFFSNSHVGCGEATSIFAGPFTVSHHKSSLLIAGYFLFFNAGSGSNQSNHLFKTGAIHQGIHERGCKFGSNAYMVLPAREGPFTSIIGRHNSHHNTSNLPYSYLFEEEGKSYLHPGASLRSAGTHRDLMKWPNRDKRSADAKDRIHFDEYNPYVGSKLLKAVELCRHMLGKEGVEVHNYERIRIKTVVLKRGLTLYELALKAFIGKILEKGSEQTREAYTDWVDAAGMFLPKKEMEFIIERIESGEIDSLENIEKAFSDVYNLYQDFSYSWALSSLEKALGHKATEKEIGEAIKTGIHSAETIRKMREEDALKDSAKLMETGYGIDSNDADVINSDFKTVRKL